MKFSSVSKILGGASKISAPVMSDGGPRWELGNRRSFLLLLSIPASRSLPGKERWGIGAGKEKQGKKPSQSTTVFLANISAFLLALRQRVERSVPTMEETCRPQVRAVQNLHNGHWTCKCLGVVAWGLGRQIPAKPSPKNEGKKATLLQTRHPPTPNKLFTN